MNFGENLKKIRIEKGLSQKDLAERIGVTQQAIAQYERATNTPKRETLTKLAKGLNVFIFQLAPDEIVTFHSGEEFDIARNTILSNMRIKMLNDRFNLLNVNGQEKAIEQVEMLTKIEEYTKK